MLLVLAVGLGMFFNLIFMELTGLAAGGVVVPGYIAMTLHKPVQIISTIMVGLITYIIVKLISRYMLLYGRRLLILCILLGYIIGYLTKVFPTINLTELTLDITTIGFVIPGLISYWMYRQGVLETIAGLIIGGVFVRLLITIISGGLILP